MEKYVKSAGIIGAATMVSRVLGFVRDLSIAYFFGASKYTDIFVVSFGIPNLLRRFFGEGASDAAFVPVFSDYLENKTKKEFHRLASNTFNLLFIILFGIVILGILFAKSITIVQVPGFTDTPDKLNLTIHMVQMMFPYLLFVCLAALAKGVLNSYKHFLIPASAPIVLNVFMISSMFLAFVVFLTRPGIFYILPRFFLQHGCYTLYSKIETPRLTSGLNWLACGVLLGGLGQFLVQVPMMYKKGMRYIPTLDLHSPGLHQILRLMIPVIIGQSAAQLNIIIDRVIASFLPEESITYLNYGNRLVQLPLAVFGIAISTAILPTFSYQAARNEISEINKTLLSALRLIMLIIVPASVGLIVMRTPIVALLFEHGKFDRVATQGTAWALLFYSLGLFSYSGVKIVAQSFYALKDTKTPVITSIIAMVTNTILNIILMRTFLKHGGLALATALSSTLNLILLLMLIRNKIGKLNLPDILGPTLRIGAATAIMGISCWYMLHMISSWWLPLRVFIPIGVSVTVYSIACWFLRVTEFKTLVETIKARLQNN